MIPLAGEPLALDLVNTLALGPDGEDLDLLASPGTAAAWLDAQHDLGRLTGTGADDLDLPALRRLRSAVADCVEHARQGREPPATALAHLNDTMRAAPASPRLSWTGTAVTRTTGRTGDGRRDLAAELAEAAATLLGDPAVTRVRGCAATRCRLLFLPANPRRRWCSPTTCGNRERVARHYRKSR
jgi:predicted RNA-binding Zn ribbon-like protein